MCISEFLLPDPPPGVIKNPGVLPPMVLYEHDADWYPGPNGTQRRLRNMDASRRSPATQSTAGANPQTLTAASQHALVAPPGPALAGAVAGEGTLATEGSPEHPH
eukprot:1138294-Pelagomonas_calceolata.AAC.1